MASEFNFVAHAIQAAEDELAEKGFAGASAGAVYAAGLGWVNRENQKRHDELIEKLDLADDSKNTPRSGVARAVNPTTGMVASISAIIALVLERLA